MIYEFHPEAEQEFIEAAAYYERSVTTLIRKPLSKTLDCDKNEIPARNQICHLTDHRSRVWSIRASVWPTASASVGDVIDSGSFTVRMISHPSSASS